MHWFDAWSSMRLALVAMLMLVAPFGPGCSFDEGEPASAGADPDGCVDDDDCPGGRCQFGICAFDTTETLDLAMLIEPPAYRTELVALHVPQIALNLGRAVDDVVLASPTRVRGGVVFNSIGVDPGEPVSAELRFLRVDGVPGYAQEETTRSAAATGEYAIDLAAGTYDVSIVPDRPEVSRSTSPDVVIGEGVQVKLFPVPAPGEYRVVEGHLTRGALDEPVAAAKVFARSTSGRLESTVAVTDADGKFVVLVPPGDEPFEFHVRPTEGSRWVPYAVYEPVSLDPDARVEIRNLTLGPIGEPVSFTVRAHTPDGTPVEDVTIAVRSVLEPGSNPGGPALVSGRYVTTVGYDGLESGLAPVSTPSGRVEIHAASTNPSLGLGVPVVLEADATMDGAEVSVEIERRHRVSGRVVTPDGLVGVADVEIVASLLPSDVLPLGSYPVPSSAFSARVETTEDGAFSFAGQPGRWEIALTPPTESGFARAVHVLELGRGPVEGAELELADAGVVLGRVLDPDRAPVAGATVQVFEVVDGAAEPVGDAVTDSDGVYRLVLPVPD